MWPHARAKTEGRPFPGAQGECYSRHRESTSLCVFPQEARPRAIPSPERQRVPLRGSGTGAFATAYCCLLETDCGETSCCWRRLPPTWTSCEMQNQVSGHGALVPADRSRSSGGRQSVLHIVSSSSLDTLCGPVHTRGLSVLTAAEAEQLSPAREYGLFHDPMTRSRPWHSFFGWKRLTAKTDLWY